MKTIETEILVRNDKTAVVVAKLPDDVPVGRHRAVLLIEDHGAAQTARAAAELPPLRWEGPLLVYDGALPGTFPDLLDELRRERLDGLVSRGDS